MWIRGQRQAAARLIKRFGQIRLLLGTEGEYGQRTECICRALFAGFVNAGQELL